MTRTIRLEVRLTEEEHEAYEWAAREEAFPSIAAVIRVVMAAHIKKLKRQRDEH